MGKYLKAAFFNRWNLLGLVAGIGAAIVSGYPEVLLPLVAAGEITYLAVLSGNGTFRNYVETNLATAKRAQRSDAGQQSVRRILRALPKDAVDRFEMLRERCADLRRIAAQLQQPGNQTLGGSLDSLQVEGLDRLLWVLLRLLYTHHALEQFLEKTSVESIENDIARLDNRLQLTDAGDQSEHNQKVRRALQDNLETSRARRANYEKARANHEFVELEIDRLANKITSLAELAVNRREPDFISSQVDQVAGSMVETEKTMNELDFATGLGEVNQEVPQLLRQELQ